jgi:hypothetical protein
LAEYRLKNQQLEELLRVLAQENLELERGKKQSKELAQSNLIVPKSLLSNSASTEANENNQNGFRAESPTKLSSGLDERPEQVNKRLTKYNEKSLDKLEDEFFDTGSYF